MSLKSVSEIFKVYHEGQIDFKFSWSYMAIANNFSQMVSNLFDIIIKPKFTISISICSQKKKIAMFCLILFYTTFRHELSPLSPIKQYLCIKFVIFATFWYIKERFESTIEIIQLKLYFNLIFLLKQKAVDFNRNFS